MSPKQATTIGAMSGVIGGLLMAFSLTVWAYSFSCNRSGQCALTEYCDGDVWMQDSDQCIIYCAYSDNGFDLGDWYSADCNGA